MDRKYEQQYEECDHHYLGNFFDAFFQTCGADCKARGDDDDHPKRHNGGSGEHHRKKGAYLLNVFAVECAGYAEIKIMQHPTGNRRVKHHKQVISRERHIAV